MEFTVNDVVNGAAEVQLANDYERIRIASGPEQGLFNLNNVSSAPYDELAVMNLPWSVASNVTVGCLVAGCSGWNYLSAGESIGTEPRPASPHIRLTRNRATRPTSSVLVLRAGRCGPPRG